MKKNIKINANWTDVEADTMIERVTKSLSLTVTIITPAGETVLFEMNQDGRREDRVIEVTGR